MSCRSIMSLFDANKQAKQATNLGVSFALLLSQDRRWDAADAAARLTIVTRNAYELALPPVRVPPKRRAPIASSSRVFVFLGGLRTADMHARWRAMIDCACAWGGRRGGEKKREQRCHDGVGELWVVWFVGYSVGQPEWVKAALSAP
ncbi:hypothetical protein BHE74_00012912 [Ensete ventricosum]|nr:hypothetical protein BHE74_00012912 [Ensete ventricosum]